MTKDNSCPLCLVHDEPIMLRCGNCNHVLSMSERTNDCICNQCGKFVCVKCGSIDFRSPLYSWDEWATTCNKCGEQSG